MAEKEFTCPVAGTLSMIGGKYKSIILYHLMKETLRYSELHKRMPKATDKMLTQQLRELEKDSLSGCAAKDGVQYDGFWQDAGTDH